MDHPAIQGNRRPPFNESHIGLSVGMLDDPILQPSTTDLFLQQLPLAIIVAVEADLRFLRREVVGEYARRAAEKHARARRIAMARYGGAKSSRAEQLAKGIPRRHVAAR